MWVGFEEGFLETFDIILMAKMGRAIYCCQARGRSTGFCLCSVALPGLPSQLLYWQGVQLALGPFLPAIAVLPDSISTTDKKLFLNNDEFSRS